MYLFYDVLFQWDLKSLNPNANTDALIEHLVSLSPRDEKSTR